MPISSIELKNFKNKYFIECGSGGNASGCKAALLAGFGEAHSTEINPLEYNSSLEAVKEMPNVYLYNEDCGEWLYKILTKINAPCTIYLDANGDPNEKESPLLNSTQAIKKQSIKDHILLLDDMNNLQDEEPEQILINKKWLLDLLREINNKYTFYLIDTHCSEREDHILKYFILVADPIVDRKLSIKSYR